MKIIYSATHKNIKGNERIYVERSIDLLDNISYQVILEGFYSSENVYRKVIGLFATIKEAINLADNYITD